MVSYSYLPVWLLYPNFSFVGLICSSRLIQTQIKPDSQRSRGLIHVHHAEQLIAPAQSSHALQTLDFQFFPGDNECTCAAVDAERKWTCRRKDRKVQEVAAMSLHSCHREVWSHCSSVSLWTDAPGWTSTPGFNQPSFCCPHASFCNHGTK